MKDFTEVDKSRDCMKNLGLSVLARPGHTGALCQPPVPPWRKAPCPAVPALTSCPFPATSERCQVAERKDHRVRAAFASPNAGGSRFPAPAASLGPQPRAAACLPRRGCLPADQKGETPFRAASASGRNGSPSWTTSHKWVLGTQLGVGRDGGI